MVNKEFYQWLIAKSNEQAFITSTAQTETALEQQMGVELALRFFVYREIGYVPGLDVHEYLDQALLAIAADATYSRDDEGMVFTKTFNYLNSALSDKAFRKWNPASGQYIGKSSIAAFEVIAIGIAANIDALEAMTPQQRNDFIRDRVQNVWTDNNFITNSGAGVRGTTRLTNLLPMGPVKFQP